MELLVLALVVGMAFAGVRRFRTRQVTAKLGERNSFVTREGVLVPTDSAFEAWTSGDFNRMLAALGTETNKIDRHFLLQGIVSHCYTRREEPAMRSKLHEVAKVHLEEFSGIAPALKRDMGMLPRVTTFQQLATVLAEDGDFDAAVEVCEKALEYGLHDGTKSGFEGRVSRIRKSQAKAASTD